MTRSHRRPAPLAILAALTAALVAPSAVCAAAADATAPPTYLDDVRPILQDHCVTCHRPSGLDLGGMIAPMALTRYDEVRPWAKSIAKAVATGEMPPWHADAVHHGQFRNERSLEPGQADTLVRWAKSGALRGEGEEPATSFPSEHEGWSIGEPDLVVTLPEPFRVEDDVEDLYVDLEVPVPAEVLSEDRWIEAVEFKAGSTAVHHIIAYAYAPDSSKWAPGSMLGGIAPGADADRFPTGYGRLLKAGSKVLFEMHYHKEAGPGTAVDDRSTMAIKFADAPIDHRVMVDGIGDYTFEIPAGAEHYEVHAEHTFSKDVELLSLLPHMHLRGAEARYVAFYPDGREELLLHVPRYDFNWQTSYYLSEPKRLPKGTRVEVTMWFDNSAANPDNPDPTVAVRYGEPTTDEMMIGFMNYTNAEPDDFDVELLTDYETLFN